MFKKLISVGILVTALVGCSQSYVDETKYTIKGKPVASVINSIPYNDDFDFYQYEITNKIGNEINGFTLQNTPDANYHGIFLLQDEINVPLKKGDKILVVFEKGCEDCIMDIKKMD